MIEKIEQLKLIVFGYPSCFGNLPKVARDSIEINKEIFIGKEVLEQCKKESYL